MVYLGSSFGLLCRVNRGVCEGRGDINQFELGDGDQDFDYPGNYLGHCAGVVPDRRTCACAEAVLGVSGTLGAGYRSLLALLFSSAADGRGGSSGSYRQVECSYRDCYLRAVFGGEAQSTGRDWSGVDRGGSGVSGLEIRGQYRERFQGVKMLREGERVSNRLGNSLEPPASYSWRISSSGTDLRIP